MRDQNGGNMRDPNYRYGKLDMNMSNRTAWARLKNGYEY
jgi:hypothetical protein